MPSALRPPLTILVTAGEVGTRTQANRALRARSARPEPWTRDNRPPSQPNTSRRCSEHWDSDAVHEPVQRQVGRRALEQLGRALLKCHSVQPLSNPYTVWDPELETSTVEVTSTQAEVAGASGHRDCFGDGTPAAVPQFIDAKAPAYVISSSRCNARRSCSEVGNLITAMERGPRCVRFPLRHR